MHALATLVLAAVGPLAPSAPSAPPGTPIPTTTPFVQPTLPAGVHPVIIIDPRAYVTPTPRPTHRRRVATKPTPRPTRDPQGVASPDVFERTTAGGTPAPR